MLEDFLKLTKDIGFIHSFIRNECIFLSYEKYIISIYNPEEHRGFGKRYSLELRINEYNGTYITNRSDNKINFALDDLEVLEYEFKDIIRERKLKELGI
jgi:hypothetical protein